MNKFENYQDTISRLYDFPYDKLEFNKIQVADLTFQVTDDCNLQCSYCYQIHKGHHKMPFEIAKQFIDLLLENSIKVNQYIDTRASQGVVINYIGGEPFLEIDLIEQITNYFFKRVIETDHPWQYNWRIGISSNGVLYFNKKVQDFLLKWKNHISFNISIDGNKELHDTCRLFPNGKGSYDIAMKAVHHYVNTLHGYMGSKMTLAPENVQYTCEAVKNLINEGYTEIFLNCIFEKGWTVKHAKILYNELIKLSDYLLLNNLEDKIYISMFDSELFRPMEENDNRNWCGGTGSMLAVDWKGDIFPCLRYMESSLGDEAPPFIIGNINDGIMTTEETYNKTMELKNITRKSQSTEECFNCPIAEGCAWCSGLNYQETGGILNKRATHICIMHKARALANCYFWNRNYIKNNIPKRMKLYLPDNEALKIIDEKDLQLLKILQYPIK